MEPDLQLQGPVVSTAGSCIDAAEARLLTRFPEVRDKLAWHVERGCRKSGRAMTRGGSALSETEREKYCRRHVLVPVYLDICLHFRDVICAPAFAPCWEWAREQYGRCLAGDAEWFALP